MAFIKDTFTGGTTPVNLTTHTPDTGTAWAVHPSYSNTISQWGSGGNVAFGSSATASLYYATDTPPSADYPVQCQLIHNGTVSVAGVAARVDSTAKTFYFVWYSSSAARWELYSFKAGTLSPLRGSYSDTFTSGARTVRLTCTDNGSDVDLEVHIDGVSRITYTDVAASSPITAAGHAGLFLGGNSSGTCYLADNFQAGTPLDLVTCTPSGTIGGGVGEFTVRDSGGTVILTLTGDTWVTAGATFDAQRQNIIDGLDAATSPTNGWNNTIRDVIGVSTVVRTSDTVVTITVPATSGYALSANETITPTIPAAALVTSSGDVTGSTFTITDESAGTVTVTDSYTANRVYCTDNGGTTRSMTVAGTYTGTPTTIEARVISDVDGSGVTSWATVDAAPSGGTWSGSVSVPDGGPYNFEARFSNDIGATDATANGFLVGYVFALAGQSNGFYWYSSATETLTANDGARWAASSWVDPDLDASNTDGLIAFMNQLISSGIGAAGIIVNSPSSTGLNASADTGAGYWLNFASAPYSTLDGYVNARSQDELTGVIWVQGENDAVSSISEAQYTADLATLFARMRTDWTNKSGLAALPIFVMPLGRRTTVTTDAMTQAIRNAQRAACEADANVYEIAAPIDLDLRDFVHRTEADIIVDAQRTAVRAAEVMGLTAAGSGLGPTATWSRSGTTVTVTLTHGGGTDFTPTTGITGFEFLDGGTPISISSAVRTNATTITLTLASAPTGAEVLRYLHGTNPTITGAVVDNSALGLPLAWDEALGATPSPSGPSPPASGFASLSLGLGV